MYSVTIDEVNDFSLTFVLLRSRYPSKPFLSDASSARGVPRLIRRMSSSIVSLGHASQRSDRSSNQGSSRINFFASFRNFVHPPGSTEPNGGDHTSTRAEEESENVEEESSVVSPRNSTTAKSSFEKQHSSSTFTTSRSSLTQSNSRRADFSKETSLRFEDLLMEGSDEEEESQETSLDAKSMRPTPRRTTSLRGPSGKDFKLLKEASNRFMNLMELEIIPEVECSGLEEKYRELFPDRTFEEIAENFNRSLPASGMEDGFLPDRRESFSKKVPMKIDDDEDFVWTPLNLRNCLVAAQDGSSGEIKLNRALPRRSQSAGTYFVETTDSSEAAPDSRFWTRLEMEKKRKQILKSISKNRFSNRNLFAGDGDADQGTGASEPNVDRRAMMMRAKHSSTRTTSVRSIRNLMKRKESSRSIRNLMSTGSSLRNLFGFGSPRSAADQAGNNEPPRVPRRTLSDDGSGLNESSPDDGSSSGSSSFDLEAGEKAIGRPDETSGATTGVHWNLSQDSHGLGDIQEESYRSHSSRSVLNCSRSLQTSSVRDFDSVQLDIGATEMSSHEDPTSSNEMMSSSNELTEVSATTQTTARHANGRIRRQNMMDSSNELQMSYGDLSLNTFSVVSDGPVGEDDEGSSSSSDMEDAGAGGTSYS